MDGSEDTSGFARSLASPAPGAAYPASSNGLGLARADGLTSIGEEEEQQLRLMISSSDEGGSLRSSAGAAGCKADVSLREWLDRPGRTVDFAECLPIFRRIVEAVGLAHAQGVVVGNVRPSCFVLSPLDRVESASCSTSGFFSSSGAAGTDPGPPGRQASPDVPSSSTRPEERMAENNDKEKKTFPSNQSMLMESSWNTSPEEAEGGPSTFASDIYRLGVLLFELFCRFDSLDQKLRTMADLRHRLLPRQLLLEWPKESSFCLWLLHSHPDTRPKMRNLPVKCCIVSSSIDQGIIWKKWNQQ